LVRLDASGLLDKLPIGVIHLDLTGSLMPSLSLSFDNPWDPGASYTNAKCIALMLNAKTKRAAGWL
jgi:hypothetical protein